MNHPDHAIKSRVAAISIFASAGMAAAPPSAVSR
jgi:hypothetical protein